LVRQGVAVHAFNHRDLAGIFDMIRTVGALIGAVGKAETLAQSLLDGVAAARRRSEALPHRPRVYFEEWDEPMISGIGWVSELVDAAGGTDVFPQLARQKSAKDRIVSAPEVIAAAPDIIIGSWCGKKFVPTRVIARPGFQAVPAVRDGFLREVKSTVILQPGPAALTDGLAALQAIVGEWSAVQRTPRRVASRQ